MPLEVREIDSVVARAAPIIKVTEKFFDYIYDDAKGIPTIGTKL